MRKKAKQVKAVVIDPQWSTLNADAAGLDIGASEIWVAVPPDRDPNPVRAFSTYTPDLNALAAWLTTCRVTSVAMESTGVYWIPIFELLEARGCEVYLVNASHIKNVPGRKSDVADCQWIQRLHSYGLLSSSFRPEAEIVVLRAYLRQRAMLIEHRAPHIQHMQKALQQMNLQLTQSLSDITGVTGLQIIRAIVAGERDPLVLARFRQPTCHSSDEDIAKALTGHYRPEHVFALQQALVLYDAYTAQLALCDRQIEAQYAASRPRFDPDDPDHPLGPDPKPNSHSKNAPDFDVRTPLFKLAGVDLTAVAGFNASAAQTVLAEIGTDMSAWPSAKPAGGSSAAERSRPTTGPPRRCAWRRRRPDAKTAGSAPTIARCGRASAPSRPSPPPPTSWPGSSTTCSRSVNLTRPSRPRRMTSATASVS